jgi:thioredoxin reductase
MSQFVEVAIVGAGPYGLSIASHLRARGVEFRIFGRPMHTWRAGMPTGMQLKSEAFATDLSDPAGSFTLRRFLAGRGGVDADESKAVRLESFVAYGMAFQKRFVPEIEDRTVRLIARTPAGFRLDFADGDSISAGRVLLAIGLTSFGYLPPELHGLPRELVSHSADHGDLEVFRGREVIVLGGGSSAVETATLLHERGAAVRLVTRRATIRFQPPPLRRPLWRRALRPLSGIGYGWHSQIAASAPQLFRLLPDDLRLRGVARYLAPAPGWFVKERFVGRVSHLAGYAIEAAEARGPQVELRLSGSDGSALSLRSDHVIAATGYRLELDRLGILAEDLRRQIRIIAGAPLLSASFESSVPGLYFVGPLSANCFGPAMRFVLGADFTSRRLGGHLAAARRRPPLAAASPRLAG